MTRRWCLSFVFVLLALALVVPSANAQWIRNGVRVCDNPGYNQGGQQLIPDGQHGAIIVWFDYRNGSNWDIFGNRIEPDGHIYDCGVPITQAPFDQMGEQIIPDGTGGVIAAWMDNRTGYDIYAQRVDGAGTPHWATDGIPINVGFVGTSPPKIVTDGAGGAIIAWADSRRGQYDIYAQRVTADGDTLWKANGMPVDTTQGEKQSVEMVSDGAGGAILIWWDNRSLVEWDIYAQRVGGDGSLLWGTSALPVRVDPSSLASLAVCPTSDGGACVVWCDNRYGYYNSFAQKIDPSGYVVWQNNGAQLCSYGSDNWYPQAASDGAGGAIVVWSDDRTVDYPTYAQRIDSTGALAWSQDGTQVFSMGGMNNPSIIPDESGGAFVGSDVRWVEYGPSDIYVQRLDHDGNLPWGPKGAAACDAAFNQYQPVMTSDELGGVIVAWADERLQDGLLYIYSQRIGPSGLWGEPEPQIVSCEDVAVDQGGWVRIRAKASSHDVAAETVTPIFGYNAWRLIGGGGPKAVSANAAGTPTIDRAKLVALLSDPATAVGVRVLKAQAASLGLPEGDWEAVGFWFATRDTMYAVAVPTRDDSTGAGTAEETYCVTAHASTPGVFVASVPATGHSVDNLAPALTTGFAGNETASPPGLELTWSPNAASDIRTYNVYRGDNERFVTDVSNLIGSTGGTALHDGAWVKALQYFYKLVAVDKHGNMGPAALLRPEDINVGTMLQSFAAALKQSAIEVSWKLSEADETVSFNVLRSAAGGEFTELPTVDIAREGLSFTMSDKSVEPGTAYRYRVAVVEGSGTRTLFETDALSTPAMPLTLNQNHPNPFNPSTTISYYLPAAGAVTLDIYDSTGRLISRLVDGATQERGTHEVAWRGVDTAGRSVSSGVYFYRLTSGKETISKKMVLLR